jgi:hypothetical protein
MPILPRRRNLQTGNSAMARIIERDRKRIRLEADAPEQVLDPSNNSEPF